MAAPPGISGPGVCELIATELITDAAIMLPELMKSAREVKPMNDSIFMLPLLCLTTTNSAKSVKPRCGGVTTRRRHDRSPGECSESQPGEVLVTSTVKDLVAGSGIKFTDRGTRTLRGVPDQWQVFTAEA